MPERFSDEHMRLLEMGIPVYPGDEATIAGMAEQRRYYSAQYPNVRSPYITGAPMGGNVTPRFGMDTARQRSTNLGLPPAKRKTVKTISADPAVADKVVETIEDEVPSNVPFPLSLISSAKAATTTIAKDEARPNMGAQWTGKDYGQWDQFLRSEPPRIPSFRERFAHDPIGSVFGYDEYKTYSPEADIDYPTQYGPRWADRSDPHPFWGEGNLPRIITAPANVASKIVGGTTSAIASGLEDVGTRTAETVAGLARTQEEHDAYLAAQAKEQAILEGKDDVTTPPPPPRQQVVAGLPQPDFESGDPASRIYYNWSRDIPTERKEYIRAMKDIYFKMSMLSAVASLTGGEDQSEGFGRMQVEMLNYMMETDNQDRLLKIHKGVYFNKDGKWDPPKNERMAHQRATRFGAGPAEASEMFGFYPKEAESWQNWLVTEKATKKSEVMASKGRPKGYDPELFTFTIVPPSAPLKGKFKEYRYEFRSAPNEDARQSVARRWAREIIRQSGMPIVQPPTTTQIQEAYDELRMGKEYEVEDMSGRQD